MLVAGFHILRVSGLYTRARCQVRPTQTLDVDALFLELTIVPCCFNSKFKIDNFIMKKT